MKEYPDRPPILRKKCRRGRPREFEGGLVDMHISLTFEQRDWLDAQCSTISAIIRGLIDRAMKKER